MKLMSLRLKVCAAMFLGALAFGMLPEPMVVTLEAISCLNRTQGVADACTANGGTLTNHVCNQTSGIGNVTCQNCNAACRSAVTSTCSSHGGNPFQNFTTAACNWP